MFFPGFFIQLSAELQGINRATAFYYVSLVSLIFWCSEPRRVPDFYIEWNFRCGTDIHPVSVLNSGSD